MDELKFGNKDMAEAKKGLAASGERKSAAEGDLEVTSKDLAIIVLLLLLIMILLIIITRTLILRLTLILILGPREGHRGQGGAPPRLHVEGGGAPGKM